MAEINVEMLKEALYKVSKALFCIGETCVDVSKQHISEEKALDKIRGYLNDANMWSRFQVDQLIEDCIEPIVHNINFEVNEEWLKKVLSEQPLQIFADHKDDYPSCCDGCSNNPKNGGSGICNCTLPYMQNPVMYNTGDSCMVNNIDDYAYFVKDLDTLKGHPANVDRITDAVERTKKYIKE